MSEPKPDCGDFIIAAIRKLRRPVVRNMQETAKAGVALHTIWSIATERYTRDEFEKALNLLLQNQLVTLSFSYFHHVEGVVSSPHRYRLIGSYPAGADPGGRKWKLDLEDRVLDENTEAKEYQRVSTPKLHVVADGLPQKVLRLKTTTKPTPGSIAEQIIEELSKK